MKKNLETNVAETSKPSSISRLKKLPVAMLAATALTACNGGNINGGSNNQPQPGTEILSGSTNYTIMPSTPFKLILPNGESISIEIALTGSSDGFVMIKSEERKIGDWKWLLDKYEIGKPNIDAFRKNMTDNYFSDTANNGNYLGSKTIYNEDKDYAITFMSIPKNMNNNLANYGLETNLHFNMYVTQNLKGINLKK